MYCRECLWSTPTSGEWRWGARGGLPLFTGLPLSDPWPFFLQGHPDSMKIGVVGRCHLHVGFPLVPKEPDAKCDAGAFRRPELLLRARIPDSVSAGSFRRRPYFHTRCVL